MNEAPGHVHRWHARIAVAAAAVVGLALLIDTAVKTGATYDEVTYLEVGARWWRTGDQDAITRMGSPLTFWKIQQTPVLLALDLLGRQDILDDPLPHRSWLLPWMRVSSAWIWLLAFALTVRLASMNNQTRAGVMAAWLFAVGPNLLAHGSLLTMEMPITACVAAVVYLFCVFLHTHSRIVLAACAGAAGVGMSCKFTMILIPPLLALLWWIDLIRTGTSARRALARIAKAALPFAALMIVSNLAVTCLALTPLSQQTGDHPAISSRLGAAAASWVGRLAELRWPSDWVGFATQWKHQSSGGPSYLLGKRGMNGWWYYYPIALAVKLPLGLALVLAARIGQIARRLPRGPDLIIAGLPLLFFAVVIIGSRRNYGVRYLLPMAPLVIAWLARGADGPRIARWLAWTGVAIVALATAFIHPHYLSFFNHIGGGPRGGRFILADSNLDWGQGPPSLARLQRRNPRLRDLTLYQFGQADPSDYGVVGRTYMIDAGQMHPGLPPSLACDTPFLAVSASLQWGPWGPDAYFRALDHMQPIALTDDGTIAVYSMARTDASPAQSRHRPPPTEPVPRRRQ